VADLTPAQKTALASEINADPRALGYAGKTNVQVAALLNTPGLAAADAKLNAGIVKTSVLISAVVGSEFGALTAANQNLCQMYFGVAELDTSNVNVRAGLGGIFGVGTATRANLLAAVDRTPSRAEALFGAGFSIDQRDVSAALNRSV
jgi:hypothetical protein